HQAGDFESQALVEVEPGSHAKTPAGEGAIVDRAFANDNGGVRLADDPWRYRAGGAGGHQGRRGRPGLDPPEQKGGAAPDEGPVGGRLLQRQRWSPLDTLWRRGGWPACFVGATRRGKHRRRWLGQ